MWHTQIIIYQWDLDIKDDHKELPTSSKSTKEDESVPDTFLIFMPNYWNLVHNYIWP